MRKKALRMGLIGIGMVVLILACSTERSLAGEDDFYFREGTRLLKLAKPAPAAEVLTEAIRLAPFRVEAYNNRGLAYFEQKKYQEAKQDFLTAVRLAPFDKEANNNLGVLFCSLEDYDRALRYFRQAVEKGGIATAYDMTVYRNLAFAYGKKGMIGKAAEALEVARNIQGRVSGNVTFREYGERSREYTLTLEFVPNQSE
jgi:Tfp pilus assembly protein PilF